MHSKIKFAAFLIAVLLFSSCAPVSKPISYEYTPIQQQTTVYNAGAENFTLAAQNDAAALYYNQNTAEIRLENKKTGYMYSSAQGGSDNSLLSLTVSDSKGSVSYLDALNDCLKKGQYQIKQQENGFLLDMTVGEVNEILFAPKVILESRFEEILSNADEYDKSRLNMRYYKPNPATMTDDIKKSLYENYPVLSERSDLYVLRAADIPPAIQREIDEILKACGYTQSNYDEDVAIGGSVEAKVIPSFTISLAFSLNDSCLSVEIDMAKTNYFKGYRLENLSLLPNFGSESADKEGYVLLPDGCGSIMYFNNGKVPAQKYTRRVYGEDIAACLNVDPTLENQIYLPVFGIKCENSALFAVIKDGAAIARINADNSSHGGRNTVNADFILTDKVNQTAITAGEKESAESFSIFQQNRYDGKIGVDYYLLSGGDADYNGMAQLYKKLLFAYKTPSDGTPASLMAEVITGIEVKKNTLGVTYRKFLKTTSFDEAAKLLTELKTDVEHLEARLRGFYNGGYLSEDIKKPKIISALGGQNGFTALLDTMAANKITVYPDFLINWSYQNIPKAIGIRQINDGRGIIYPFSKTRTTPDTSYRPKYLLTPHSTADFASVLAENYSQYGNPYISLREIGNILFSDFAVEGMSREEAAGIYAGILEKLQKEHSFSIMAECANAYALPYLTAVSGLPPSNKRADITDVSVPFYQMVVSGYVKTYSTPINLTGFSDSDRLDYYKTGTHLYFTTAAKTDKELNQPDTDFLYAIGFDDIRKEVAGRYNSYAKDTPPVFGSSINRFEILESGVYKTIFASGDYVIVNYNNRDAIVDGTVIFKTSAHWGRE